MKALRISASIFALTALSLLAACGGGGGGGGGGTPPTSAPTGSPTGHPSSSPTPTPTPTATATATSSGSVLVNTSHTVKAEENFQNGYPGTTWYTSGVTTSWANTAGGTSNTTPPQTTGSSFDGMTCEDTQEGLNYPAGAYSQHAFVGIYNNTGTEEYLPQAIGMVNPTPPVQSTPDPSAANPSPTPYPNNTFAVEHYQCEYNMHTHDYSGLIHMEDPNLPQNTSYTYAPSWATLQTLLDEWGATISSGGLTAGASSLTGTVTIYTGMPSTTVNGADLVNSYSVYTGTPGNLKLFRHEAVWIVVGTSAANIPPNGFGSSNGLPQVTFVTTN
jgi:hypothetical protein